MEFTDFSIVAQDGDEIRCHRAILAAASPVFRGMMSGEWQETLQTLERRDIAKENIVTLLEFIYLGRLPADVEYTNLMKLAQIADYYQMPSLVNQCAARISAQVNELFMGM